jgi:hypothetical protein
MSAGYDLRSPSATDYDYASMAPAGEKENRSAGTSRVFGKIAEFLAAETGAISEIPANSTVGRVLGNLDQYPQVVDPRTGGNIPFPTSVGNVVPQAQRVSWGAAERSNFITEWYQRGYATPNGGWENYDIRTSQHTGHPHPVLSS